MRLTLQEHVPLVRRPSLQPRPNRKIIRLPRSRLRGISFAGALP
jgi:hypothetical protein